MAIWNWLQQNATALTGLGNLLFVVIWTFYLQLFYRQYCRQQRAELVIHHAQGTSPSAGCLLVNMSQEAVHVQCVLAQIESEDAVRTHQVTDYGRISAGDPNTEQLLRQGPLKSGDYLWLGRFEDIVGGHDSREEQVLGREQLPLPLSEIRSLELRTVVIHGPSDHSIGARRRFVIRQRDGQMKIYPEQLYTDQLTSRRDRSQVRRWLQDCFTPAATSGRDGAGQPHRLRRSQ